MRFSLMEQKIAVARLLRHYTLSTCSLSTRYFRTKTIGIYSPAQSVHLQVTHRH